MTCVNCFKQSKQSQVQTKNKILQYRKVCIIDLYREALEQPHIKLSVMNHSTAIPQERLPILGVHTNSMHVLILILSTISLLYFQKLHSSFLLILETHPASSSGICSTSFSVCEVKRSD